MKMKMVEAVKVTLFALALCLPLAAFAGPATDTDGDGVADVFDNCVSIANAGTLGCDSDIDGYGNVCDGDFNQDNATDGADFSPTFLNDFTNGSMSANSDGNPDGSNMNCDGSGAVDGADFNPLFLNQFVQGSPGPSGLSCAGSVPCL